MFRTERLPKYTPRQSIWRWVRTHRAPRGITRGVRSDIIACTVITPVAIIITYACLYSSDYYNEKKFVLLPAARWTSLSLLIMIGIMLIGYYLWVYSVIRMHSRMWYNWWQRDCVVRYIPPSNTQICCHPPAEVANLDAAASTALLLEIPSAENNESESFTSIQEVGSDSEVSEESEEKIENEVVAVNIPEEEIITIDIPEEEISHENADKETKSEI